MAKVFGLFDVIVHGEEAQAQFEAFVVRAAPTVPPWPGIKSYVLKGDRGDRAGRVHYMIDMVSDEIRNRYFPEGKAISTEGMERLAAMSDFIIEWEQYADYGAGRTPWTDYVVIGEF